MNRVSKTVELFKGDYSCAQSILIAFADEVGIDKDFAFRIGAGLGGGIGREQHICGAINAGAIILGLKYGKYAPQDKVRKEEMVKIVADFVNQCESHLGGTQCLELIKIDLNNDELRQYASDCGYFDKICNNAVEKSAMILEKILSQK